MPAPPDGRGHSNGRRRGPVRGVDDYWVGIWPARPAPAVALSHRPAVPPALVASIAAVLLAGVASAVLRVGT